MNCSDVLCRYELLSRDAESDSIGNSVAVATKMVDKSARLVVESKATTIIRFIGNSDSSTNLDAFDPVVLITGICEQILTTRCAIDEASCQSSFAVVHARAARHFVIQPFSLMQRNFESVWIMRTRSLCCAPCFAAWLNASTCASFWTGSTTWRTGCVAPASGPCTLMF